MRKIKTRLLFVGIVVIFLASICGCIDSNDYESGSKLKVTSPNGYVTIYKNVESIESMTYYIDMDVWEIKIRFTNGEWRKLYAADGNWV